jgi:hypothetical protein
MVGNLSHGNGAPSRARRFHHPERSRPTSPRRGVSSSTVEIILTVAVRVRILQRPTFSVFGAGLEGTSQIEGK